MFMSYWSDSWVGLEFKGPVNIIKALSDQSKYCGTLLIAYHNNLTIQHLPPYRSCPKILHKLK